MEFGWIDRGKHLNRPCDEFESAYDLSNHAVFKSLFESTKNTADTMPKFMALANITSRHSCKYLIILIYFIN